MIKRFVIFYFLLSLSLNASFAAPLKTGHFVVGLPDYPKHLLNYIGGDEYGTAVNRLVLEPLIELSPKTNQPEPRLAQRWKVENSGKRISFYLNPAAKFQDGTKVTASDVEFTWDLIQNNPHLIPSRGNFQAFKRCRAVSPLLFQCDATTPHFKNLEMFSHLLVLPAHHYRNQDIKLATATSLLGSGPYRLTSVFPGEKIVLARNTDFWGKDLAINRDRYHFNAITFRAVSDPQTQFELFKKGEIDYFHFLISKMWFAETDTSLFTHGYIKKLKLENRIPHTPMSLAWNLRRPLFADLKVRQALTHLMNREKWIQYLFYGAYVLATGPVSIHSEYHSNKIAPLRYDPKRARELLTQAGWKANSDGVLEKEGKKFTFELLSDSPALNRFLTLYQEDLKQMGILMTIKTVDWATSLRLVEEREFDVVPLSRTRDVDPSDFAAEWGSEEANIKGSRNLTGYQNKTVDELAKKIDATLNKKERIQWVQQLDEIISHDLPVSYAWEPTYFRLGYWDRFSFPEKGFYPYSRWRDAFHYWWYDPRKDELLKKALKENIPLG